jgi:hypothetical protein
VPPSESYPSARADFSCRCYGARLNEQSKPGSLSELDLVPGVASRPSGSPVGEPNQVNRPGNLGGSGKSAGFEFDYGVYSVVRQRSPLIQNGPFGGFI